MGLHASYYPMPQEQLERLIRTIQTPEGNWEISLFREPNRDKEYYMSTRWHVIDVMLTTAAPEFLYAVRGHAFPAPDGSVEEGPHMPSYDDEYWQIFTYVTAQEVQDIARVFSRLTAADLEACYRLEEFERAGVYRLPLDTSDLQADVDFALGLGRFYNAAAATGHAVLISIG